MRVCSVKEALALLILRHRFDFERLFTRSPSPTASDESHLVD